MQPDPQREGGHLRPDRPALREAGELQTGGIRFEKRAAHFASMDLQCLLLREEGVEVLWTPKGWKTDLKLYGWKNTMEEALELNRAFFSMNI